jgi:hypothetical protein
LKKKSFEPGGWPGNNGVDEGLAGGDGVDDDQRPDCAGLARMCRSMSRIAREQKDDDGIRQLPAGRPFER